MRLFEKILEARGLVGGAANDFLHPDYGKGHDPFLLPDMEAAVDRLLQARERQEHITIYGDYDIDGLTATTILLDAFAQFGKISSKRNLLFDIPFFLRMLQPII